MRLFEDKRLVAKTPILTTLFLESANLGQIFRMWAHQTADGQSLVGWILVNAALLLWLNFYYEELEEGEGRKWAIWATTAGILLNACVIISVIVFRYII